MSLRNETMKILYVVCGFRCVCFNIYCTYVYIYVCIYMYTYIMVVLQSQLREGIQFQAIAVLIISIISRHIGTSVGLEIAS